MLSTNSPMGIQRRRLQHRRQNSIPVAFETAKVRQLPANIQKRRQNRSGLSLDLNRSNLETVAKSLQASIAEDSSSGFLDMPYPEQADSTVSFTNIGQTSQHTMQVAQKHSKPQPGILDTFLGSPVQISLPSPRTPNRAIRAQSPQQPPLSPSKVPTQQQIEDLKEHIHSVYGSSGQFFINILPTPTATPQKPAQLLGHDSLDNASVPPIFTHFANAKLEPTSSNMNIDIKNPDMDIGYESSSYYTSDELSPSPMSSPLQRSVQSFFECIEEQPLDEMAFSVTPPHFPLSNVTLPTQCLENSLLRPTLLPEVEMDASLEYTGISSEDVQRYISEQDPTTNKWMCLYPKCSKVFGRRENIRSHVQTHLGDRQYRCNGCGKCFVRQHDLKRHAKIHTGTKPYKCPCGAGFARQDALTRHRQRGMCVGGYADAVRRQAKRGRPRKHRPEMEQRTEKACKTRRAMASVASSVSFSSPPSEVFSSPSFEDILGAEPLSDILPETASFSEPISPSADPFNFEVTSSQFADNANASLSSFAPSSSYSCDDVSMSLLQQLSQNTHTPPMSPAAHRPCSVGSSGALRRYPFQTSSLKGTSTASQASIQSNPLSTPPTSPARPQDGLDDLFSTLPDNTCSQFDLELKAMGDFTSLDASSYEFLDFTI